MTVGHSPSTISHKRLVGDSRFPFAGPEPAMEPVCSASPTQRQIARLEDYEPVASSSVVNG